MILTTHLYGYKIFLSRKSPSLLQLFCLPLCSQEHIFFKRKFIFLWKQLLGSRPQKGNKNSPAFWKRLSLQEYLSYYTTELHSQGVVDRVLLESTYSVKCGIPPQCQAGVEQAGRNHVSSQLPARWGLSALAQTPLSPYSSDTCGPTAASCKHSSPASLWQRLFLAFLRILRIVILLADSCFSLRPLFTNTIRNWRQVCYLIKKRRRKKSHLALTMCQTL